MNWFLVTQILYFNERKHMLLVSCTISYEAYIIEMRIYFYKYKDRNFLNNHILNQVH
jgi:hypothetical protein